MTPDELRRKAALALQAGKLEKAKHLYEKLVKKNTKDPSLWLALGFIAGRLDNFRSAINLLKKARQLQSNNPDIIYNLGVAYQNNNQHEQAAECFRQALTLNPKLIHARFNLAMSLQESEKHSDAIKLFQQLMAEQPKNPEFLIALASAYFKNGDYQQAIEHTEQAVQHDPGSTKAYHLMGLSQISMGQHESARKSLESSLRIDPDQADVLNGLAEYHFWSRNLEAGVDILKHSLEIQPDQADVILKIGSVFQDLGRPEDARRYYLRAITLNNTLWDAHTGLANAQEMLGDWGAATETYKKMLAIDANSVQARAGLAHILERKHQQQDAMELLGPLLEEPQPCISAICTYANICKENKESSAAIPYCEEALKRPDTGSRDKCLLHFNLGKLYNDSGDYAKAFSHFREGNELEKTLHWHRYNPEKQANFVDWSIENYTEASLQTLPRSTRHSKQPVFVIGMPRSGTSLTEQIISSHPDAHGAGELTDVYDFAQSLPANIGNIKNSPLASNLEQITKERINSFADRYLKRLASFSPSAARIVDKMPGNFLYLGIIELAFPDAYIIHCKRNPIDTCLSIYFQQFTSSQSYANDLKSLGHYYLEYLRLMSHWKQICTIPILDISYESLITDPEGHIHDLINFIDLDWNDRCLEFHRTKRDVNTPSYQQVRQPIYSSSVERWRNYSTEIRDLTELLSSYC